MKCPECGEELYPKSFGIPSYCPKCSNATQKEENNEQPHITSLLDLIKGVGSLCKDKKLLIAVNAVIVIVALILFIVSTISGVGSAVYDSFNFVLHYVLYVIYSLLAFDLVYFGIWAIRRYLARRK